MAGKPLPPLLGLNAMPYQVMIQKSNADLVESHAHADAADAGSAHKIFAENQNKAEAHHDYCTHLLERFASNPQ